MTPEIEELYNKAYDLAVVEVIKLARKVMKDNPRCVQFCMCMGGASFYDKDGEPIGEWGRLPYPKYLREFDKVVDGYDRLFRITGYPVKIKGYDGVEVTDW